MSKVDKHTNTQAEWEQYYEELVRLGLIGQESRRAVIAPRYTDFAPVKAKGKPASEIIIEERGER